MKHGVSAVGALGLILTLWGCGDDSSSGAKQPPGSAAGTSSGGSSNGEEECDFDLDEDGYCDPRFTSTKPDCNEYNAAVHPDALELPNAVDDDCDGVIDNGVNAACPLTLEAPPGGCEKGEQLVSFGAGACLLVESGRVLCWGHNASGALGTPDVVNAPVPIEVPGVVGATALAAGPGAVCALAGDVAICWGAGSSFPFKVPLPEGTAQIALGRSKLESGASAYLVAALDDAGQVWARPLLPVQSETPEAPLEFQMAEAGAKQLVGGTAVCSVTMDDQLLCPDPGGQTLVTVAAQVELVVQSYDGSLCYKSAGQLYCAATPAAGTVVAGNASAIGAAAVTDMGCAFNESGRLACWSENGPTSVNDASQLALGYELGCVLRQSGKVSCWGSADGGKLGNGRARPGWEKEAVDVLAAPTLKYPQHVLLAATPLGACDTLQDLGVLHQGVRLHTELAACKAECENTLDASACFATCAAPGGLTGGCFNCFANLATCAGADCYDAFQTCAGYPVDFTQALNNDPRFACEGASCLQGKSIGQSCSDDEPCATGLCGALPQAPGAKVCVAANGTFCWKDSPHCDCNIGSDYFGATSYGYCGSCASEGRTASQAGDCYRDCTQESFCTSAQECRYFSDGRTRYCF